MDKLAVLRYAKALFDIAVENNAVAEYNLASVDMLAVFESDPEIIGILNHPSIPLDSKIGAVATAFDGRVPSDFVGMIALMLRRGRNDEIVGVLQQFDVLYKEYAKLAVAKIYAPEQLDQARIDEIVQIVSRRLDKTIQVEFFIDPSLIAGFRVEVDGFVFDASIKYQMKGLKKQLLGSFY